MDYVKYIRGMVGKNKIILNASGCIIPNEFNEILLQKRSDNSLWSLPGGIIELDEDITEGAIREAFEETGLIVKIKEFIGIYNNKDMIWPNKDRARVISYIFLCEVVDGTLNCDNDETLELKYFSLDNLPKISGEDNYLSIVDYYNNKRNLVERNDFNGVKK